MCALALDSPYPSSRESENSTKSASWPLPDEAKQETFKVACVDLLLHLQANVGYSHKL
jgi:hypothetical protein